MSAVEMDDTISATRQRLQDEALRYGIVTVAVDYYHFGDFRYTNLQDAIAQAKRAESRPA